MADDYLGNLELLILLAVLRCGKDAYGFSIQEELLNTAGREISLGAIYTTLERMEAKGYVRSELATSPASKRGGRPKRLFTVLHAGLRAIRNTDQTRAHMMEGLDPLLQGA